MKENLNDKLSDALTDVDDGYIVKTARPPMKTKNLWIRVGVLAACLVLVLSAIPLWALMKSSLKPDGPRFSAEEIAGMFGEPDTMGDGTPYYGWNYVPDPSYLYLTEIPVGDYLPVYEKPCFELDENSFRDFINKHWKNVSAYLGVENESYTIDRWSQSLSVSLSDKPSASFSHGGFGNGFHMSLDGADEAERLIPNSKMILDSQLKTDEEITLALTEARKMFEKMFGREFPDTKVIQNYDRDSDVASWVFVYFYDASASLNIPRMLPDSDCVAVYFECQYDSMEIQYVEYHDQMKLISNEKVFPLEKAEELLREGYVFGRNSYECMQNQEEVDFSDYDYVGYTYIFDVLGGDSDTGKPKSYTGIPFYVFYKQIGTTECGNLIYVNTYVPAIEVSGLKEYFKSQKKVHKSKFWWE